MLAVGVSAQVGPSGIVNPDGKNVQFSHEYADNIVLTGPSGIVTKDGKNVQLPSEPSKFYPTFYTATPQVPVTVPQFVAYRAVFGPSGIVNPYGQNVQFTRETADNIVLVGPSGAVTKDGNNIQFTDTGATRSKRSAGFVSPAGIIGYSGIVRPDGTYEQFSNDFAFDIVAIGPSGIVTKSGKNVQLDDNLRRVRRNLVGPSGMISKDGTPVQFPAFATPVLTGPSGIVFSNGQNIQLQ